MSSSFLDLVKTPAKMSRETTRHLVKFEDKMVEYKAQMRKDIEASLKKSVFILIVVQKRSEIS